MQVIPSINVPDFAAAQELMKKAAAFSPWVHVDIGDGLFTPQVTWGNPIEFAAHRSEFFKLNHEAHLMLENPDDAVVSWAEAGVKRIIVHQESARDLDRLREVCANYNVELGLAISPETLVDDIEQFLTAIYFYQVLAVTPGRIGQKFQEMVLPKIKFLRQEAPDAILEVDGGITPETARLVKEAGADIVVSASYIFNSADPAAAYRELEQI